MKSLHLFDNTTSTEPAFPVVFIQKYTVYIILVLQYVEFILFRSVQILALQIFMPNSLLHFIHDKIISIFFIIIILGHLTFFVVQ